MRVYLDICCLNRPFDDARQLRIHLESEAVLGIIAAQEQRQIEIVSSDALAHENDLNPNPDRRRHVRSVLEQCTVSAQMNPSVIVSASAFVKLGFSPIDSLHLACAIDSSCDFLCTCDDNFLRKARSSHTPPPRVVSLIEFTQELGL